MSRLFDEDLIALVLEGDQAAYQTLVSRHKQQVFLIILRQVRDSHVAEDLAQETFVRAYLSLRSFQRRCKFSTWLIRIALNQSSSYFASRPYKERMRSVSFELERHDMSSDSQEQSREGALKERLCLAVGQLRPRLRAAFTLCVLEGKPYEEAAAILEIPLGTVRSRVNAARAKLTSIFAKWNDNEQ